MGNISWLQRSTPSLAPVIGERPSALCRVLATQCLEVLHRFKGRHAHAREYLSSLQKPRENLTGTTAMDQTGRARVIVSAAARTRTSTGSEGGKELEKSLAAVAPALRRQVEGGINFRDRSTCGMQADLNLPRVFSRQDEDRFEGALLAAVKDYSLPLANVFSRVQVQRLCRSTQSPLNGVTTGEKIRKYVRRLRDLSLIALGYFGNCRIAIHRLKRISLVCQRATSKTGTRPQLQRLLNVLFSLLLFACLRAGLLPGPPTQRGDGLLQGLEESKSARV